MISVLGIAHLRIAPQKGNLEVGKREVGNRKNNTPTEQNNTSAEEKQIV